MSTYRLTPNVDCVNPAARNLTFAGAMNISYGALTYQADNEVPEEWRNSEFQDGSRPIIMACELGLLGPIAGKLLKDMGFTNVCYLEGGLEAWQEAGFSTQ